MGFYELGNGCDSCDTITPSYANNTNLDATNFMANAQSPYGSQVNTNQYQKATTAGYPQSATMGVMSGGGGMNMNNGMGATTMTTTTSIPTTLVNVPVTTTTTTQQKGMKQVAVPGSVPIVISSSGQTGSGSSGGIESFTDGMGYGGGNYGSKDTWSQHNKHWIMLGLIVFSALASNECCKYFLNKSLQMNDGSPMYYFAYAGVAVLLTFAAYTYLSKN